MSFRESVAHWSCILQLSAHPSNVAGVEITSLSYQIIHLLDTMEYKGHYLPCLPNCTTNSHLVAWESCIYKKRRPKLNLFYMLLWYVTLPHHIEAISCTICTVWHSNVKGELLYYDLLDSPGYMVDSSRHFSR